MQYHIYWTAQTQLLELQGATVNFQGIDHVYYENNFLPSGRPIAIWHSQHVFSTAHRISDLPPLMRHTEYEIERHLESGSHIFAYLVIAFYDDNGQELANFSQNSDTVTFTVPEDYNYYTISLVSAGTGSFVFHDFLLRPKQQGYLRANDQLIGNQLYTQLALPDTITSKTLRVIFTEPEFSNTDYPDQWIKTTQQAVMYLASSLPFAGFFRENQSVIINQINDNRKKANARHVEFVGYGPISSYAALYYQQQFKRSRAIISRDVILDPQKFLSQQDADWTHRIQINDDWAIEQPEDYVTELPDAKNIADTTPALLIARPHWQRLTYLTYATPTPEEVRQQQEQALATGKKDNLIGKLFGK